jgi:hypothetical protein
MIGIETRLKASLFIIMLFFLPYAIDNFDDEVNRKISPGNNMENNLLIFIMK